MSSDLVSVVPGATVAEAAQVMSIHHVGAALVVEDGSLVGIFTERDIVRALATEHDAASNRVEVWMTKDPITLEPASSAEDALDLMRDHGFRHVPIVDAARLVGIVSIRDLAAR